MLVRVLKILQSDTENRISDLEILLFWKNVVPTDDEEEDTEVPAKCKGTSSVKCCTDSETKAKKGESVK